MLTQQSHFTFDVYDDELELAGGDLWLLQEARRATANAYAPYSNFLVGCAARLANNQVVTGSNQENASFPAGICGERVLLATAASLYPRIAVQTMAITYNNTKGSSRGPVTPCGICRQSLLEYEEKTGQPLRLVLAGLSGPVYIIPSACLLLPLAFGSSMLQQHPL